MENVKATRMEYLRLKRQLKTALRGHKLLKEKRDGLMKKFMAIIGQTRSQRLKLEDVLADSFKRYVLTTATLQQKELETMFMAPSAKVEVQVQQENIMSVWIPKFNYEMEGSFKSFSFLSSPLGLSDLLAEFWDAMQLMLNLAASEHAARLLSYEIEKTRRRVNALEYVIVPSLQKKISYIAAKLNEQERSEKVIRMKIKSLITWAEKKRDY